MNIHDTNELKELEYASSIKNSSRYLQLLFDAGLFSDRVIKTIYKEAQHRCNLLTIEEHVEYRIKALDNTRDFKNKDINAKYFHAKKLCT